MRQVKKRGCTTFFARIQEKNLAFFRHLGWIPDGDVEVFHGRPHQRMLADLSRVADEGAAGGECRVDGGDHG